MVVRVAQRASRAEGVDEIAVATDDERIVRAVTEAGFRALMTDPACSNGTMRIAQAARDLPADGYLNVQGDEPLIRTHDVYDVATGRWSAAAPLSRARDHLVAVAVDGRIHVIGGRFSVGMRAG